MDKEYVFGLDIGTRSIVGTIGYKNEQEQFVVIAQISREHTTRAVIDGQIHDIAAVSETIKEIKSELEAMTSMTLKEVCIAAAGRVLKTKKVVAEHSFPVETKVTEEHVRSLNMMGVENAYREIQEDAKKENKQFYCVGYSVVNYSLNGYSMSNIELHKAKKISATLIATFLPDEVVDGLYAAVEAAGLEVANLTLEPIAAIRVAIPESFRLLNIALIDIGAGTSDISIVKDGSIVAFGMMPLAGDELTESIAKEYLVDFQTAEKIKRKASSKKEIVFSNILGERIKLHREEILAATESVLLEISTALSNKIKELNGGKSVSAIFVVGGGGKLDGMIQGLAKAHGLPENRVVIRGSEVLKEIVFEQKGIKKDSTLVTPIGICLTYYEEQNNFIVVKVNEETVKIYDNNRLTVMDAAVQSGVTQNELFPERGKSITFTIDQEKVVIKGEPGESAVVTLNNKEVSLNQKIHDQDEITIQKATVGKRATVTVADFKQCKKEITLYIDGKALICPTPVYVNEQLVSPFYQVKDGDSIQTSELISLQNMREFLGDDRRFWLQNGRECRSDDLLESGMQLITKLPMQEEPVSSEPMEAENLLVEPESVEKPEEIKPVQMVSKKEQVCIVMVNQTPVVLPKKDNPIFVDILDVYPFDISQAGGRRLVTKVNGIVADFTTPVHSGDEIELTWES